MVRCDRNARLLVLLLIVDVNVNVEVIARQEDALRYSSFRPRLLTIAFHLA